MKADKDVVIAAVLNYGEALEFASDNVKGDIEVVEIAIEQNGASMR